MRFFVAYSLTGEEEEEFAENGYVARVAKWEERLIDDGHDVTDMEDALKGMSDEMRKDIRRVVAAVTLKMAQCDAMLALCADSDTMEAALAAYMGEDTGMTDNSDIHELMVRIARVMGLSMFAQVHESITHVLAGVFVIRTWDAELAMDMAGSQPYYGKGYHGKPITELTDYKEVTWEKING